MTVELRLEGRSTYCEAGEGIGLYTGDLGLLVVENWCRLRRLRGRWCETWCADVYVSEWMRHLLIH